MTTATINLPITETIEPADQQELVETVEQAYATATPIYPIGGGTSLNYGLPAKRDGIGLALSRLNRLVDYPARDMTVTVEAGITMQQLAEKLAAENQRLPVDVPQADRATLGGVIATNWNGPRRYGLGNLRDYVIGINAVDGRGRMFKGGGRVVKNVAGYDFCKLLTGSLGTLGVITQVTLKLIPVPPDLRLVKCTISELEAAEAILSRLVHTQTKPSAIELLVGAEWGGEDSRGGDNADNVHLVVALEGSQSEVDWMEKQLSRELRESGVAQHEVLVNEQAIQLWQRLVEFSAQPSPLVIKAAIVPSGTVRLIAAAREIDPQCSVQAHAGNGITVVRFSRFPADGLSRTIVGRLQPIANLLHGNIVVLSNPGAAEMTHQCVWGGIDVPFVLMTKIKQQFDPKNLLNPGRFVYL